MITPHAGEMAGLLGMTKEAVEADPLATALSAASMLCAVVALKGATTWIADPDGRAWVNRHGCVGLGTSGSGDTLAGFIAGLLARGAAPAQATAWGVYMHAEAEGALPGHMAHWASWPARSPAKSHASWPTWDLSKERTLIVLNSDR
ncbi:NAD(P)H-hydrate dehydratase [Siccirubricoccus deserti]